MSALVFAGCTTAPNTPERTDSNFPGTETQAEQIPGVEGSLPDEPPAHAPIVAREIEEQEPELAAVTYLLNQAQEALKKDEIDRAAALSDRVLQIDRKSPRAYLLLAQVHTIEKIGSKPLTAQSKVYFIPLNILRLVSN